MHSKLMECRQTVAWMLRWKIKEVTQLANNINQGCATTIYEAKTTDAVEAHGVSVDSRLDNHQANMTDAFEARVALVHSRLAIHEAKTADELTPGLTWCMEPPENLSSFNTRSDAVEWWEWGGMAGRGGIGEIDS